MLISCIVTHNRFALTKLTVESYLNSTSQEHTLVVVDNDSTDGTKEYLQSIKDIDLLILNNKNMYPGAACNLGWSEGLQINPDAQFLHRSDNDIFYQLNWDFYSYIVMEDIPNLGQFGILDLKDQHFPGQSPLHERQGDIYSVNIFYPNVGGNHVTRKKLWDQGLRHAEQSWDTVGDEDVRFSQDLVNLGYIHGHSTEHIATHLGVWWGHYQEKDYREYYRRTYIQRLNKDIYPDIPKEGSEF